MFRHPNYYKELRKLRNKEARVNDHSASISDQAISDEASTEATSVRLVRASSDKHQASSPKLLKVQATSLKPQAASVKLEAASHKLLDSRTTEKFQAP